MCVVVVVVFKIGIKYFLLFFFLRNPKSSSKGPIWYRKNETNTSLGVDIRYAAHLLHSTQCLNQCPAFISTHTIFTLSPFQHRIRVGFDSSYLYLCLLFFPRPASAACLCRFSEWLLTARYGNGMHDKKDQTPCPRGLRFLDTPMSKENVYATFDRWKLTLCVLHWGEF